MVHQPHVSSARLDTEFEVVVPMRWTYPVRFRPGLIQEYGREFVEQFGRQRVFVLTDKRVASLYGEELGRSLRSAGLQPEFCVVPEGEATKSLESFSGLLDRLAQLRCDRRSVLLNFGGGMISDLGGFVAASYMRGISYVNFSTSMLGQIDACVGGKVGVNTSYAKNFVGAFYHPRCVVGDPTLLRTLSDRDFRSGIAEGIKVAIIDSEDLFEQFRLEHDAIMTRDPGLLATIVARATALKMDRISRDPHEKDLRRELNFGHTIGHPIETEYAYRDIRHGEAVAIGMGIATAISRSRGWMDASEADRIFDLLHRYELLGLEESIRPDAVIEHVRYVRLIRGNSLNFVLPTRVGHVIIREDLTVADLVRGFEDYELIVRERLL